MSQDYSRSKYLSDPGWVKLFVKVWNDIKQYRTLTDVATALKIDRQQPKRYYTELKKRGYELLDRSKPPKILLQEQFDDNLQIRTLKNQIYRMKVDLEEAEKRALTSSNLKDFLHEIKGASFDKQSDWMHGLDGIKAMHGIPTLFISDIHFDEYVDPAQIRYINTYNREIAIKRIQYTFESAINILKNYRAKPKYDGINLCFGGDMFSGNIHEELMETNEHPILKSVLDLEEVLYQGILRLANEFKRVDIQCVVGNHGRLFVKKKSKNRVFDNYEWFMYQHLAKQFADDDRVNFVIPDSTDCVFTIYNNTFLLTHGDQFRGGNGISGIFTPLQMGLYKKQQKQAAVHMPFDIMMLGHFHQYIHTSNLIVNGSIKGYDEWVDHMNFGYQRPMQALWINHAENGMTFRTPILCDAYEGGYLKPEDLMKSLQKR